MLDHYTDANQHRLLGFLCGPLRESLCGCSLRIGFLLSALLDMVVGGFLALNLVQIVNHFSLNLPIEEITFWASIVIASLLKILLGFSAFVGIFGIKSLDIRKISQYSTVKNLSFVADIIFCIILILLILLTVPGYVMVDVLILIMSRLTIIVILISYATLVVWSAYIRIRFNETMLVFHGIVAATISNQNEMAVQELPNQQRVISAEYPL